MLLGDIIKTYREAHGLSQSELAKKARISQGTLSRIEANTQQPNSASLLRIAQALGSTVDTLLQIGEASQPLEQLNTEKVASSFVNELQELEHQLTPQQRSIVVKIARALALETVTKQHSQNSTRDEL